MIDGLGAIIPVHGPIAPVLDLLADLVGEGTAEASRPERILLVDDASPIPVDPADLPAGIDLLRRPVNGGFGAAVNTGLLELGLPLALVLNSDLRLPPGFAAELVAHAAPWQPAVVGCRNASPEGRSGYSARLFPTVAQQTTEWLVPLAGLRGHDRLHRAVGHDLAAERAQGMVPVDWVSGAVLLLPVAEVLAAGGFDEGFVMYAEEVDLALRLRERGVPVLLDADLSVVHLGGGSSAGEAVRRRRLVAARLRYAAKHGNRRALVTALTAASAVNLVWNTGRRVAGRDVAPLAVAREELTSIHRPVRTGELR